MSPPISDVSLLDASSREVLRAPKYDAAWASLSLEQRCKLTHLVKAVAIRLRDIEDALASFLFDPQNQVKDKRHGMRPLLFQKHAKDAREAILRPLRELQRMEARQLDEFVAGVVDAAFRTVPGSVVVVPAASSSSPPTTTTGGGGEEETTKASVQPMEACFENFDVSQVVPRERWTERVRTTMERAAKVVSAPDFHGLARERCFVDPSDAMFLAIKIDNRDGRTTSLNWLYAEHLLFWPGFHAEVAEAVEPLTAKKLCRVVHAPAKGSARAKEKTGPNGDYGRATPKPATRFLKDVVRASVVFESHQAFDDGYKLLLKRFAACRTPKDRRNASPVHDLQLNVFYKDFIAEIQLHFSAVLRVKPLAHLPYEIIRTDTTNLQTLHLFDFPHVHLERADRSSINCRLAL